MTYNLPSRFLCPGARVKGRRSYAGARVKGRRSYAGDPEMLVIKFEFEDEHGRTKQDR